MRARIQPMLPHLSGLRLGDSPAPTGADGEGGLTGGRREVEATGAVFRKSDPLAKFRKAVVERDDKKAERKAHAAVANLGPEQARKLAAEFEQSAAKAWLGLSSASAQEDYHKQRLDNVKALKALLEAHLGLGALYKYDPNRSVAVLPTRPDLPAIYKYHLWPSYKVKMGTHAWRDYRTIRDFWKKADELAVDLWHRR